MADSGKIRIAGADRALSLSLLGPLRLQAADRRDLTPRVRKTRAVLAVAALSPGPVTRGALCQLLWGDRGEDQARASLRQALYELRDLAAAGALASDREAVSRDPAHLETDLDRIRALADAGEHEKVANLLDTASWPALADLDDITPELDDWLREQRGRILTCVLECGAKAAESALAGGRPKEARTIAGALERADPLDEQAAGLGIRADLAAGDRPGAVRRHARLAERMQAELGIGPSSSIKALLETEPGPAAHLAAPPAAPAPSPRIADERPPNLPLFVLLAALLLAAAAAAIWFTRPAPAPPPTVAVLPFEAPGQQNERYFASGISDEILNLLSHQQRLRVLGRISANEIEQQADAMAIARKLGVTHLLDGSVRTSGDRMMVIVRLTRVSDGAQLWSERYQRQLGDIFKVQEDVAAAVAARLDRSFGTARVQQTTPEVYDRYLAARQLVRERREVTLKEAARLLREAIALDPRYAPAHAELSQVIMLLADHPTSYGHIPVGEARREAEIHARRAVALDPNLGEAYAALGFIRLSDGKSEPYYRKAVQLSPQRPEFHRWLANSLQAQNRWEEALPFFRRAVAIDPLWQLNYDHLVGALFSVGRDAEARRYARQFLTLSNDPFAKLQLQENLAKFDARAADEVRIARELYRQQPEERQMRFRLASALSLLGEHGEARSLQADEPVADAIITRDWPLVARRARALGRTYFDYASHYWSLGDLLVASGHGDVVVALYDEARPLVARGEIPIRAVAIPSTIVALRDAGRMREAQTLLAGAHSYVAKLPRVGQLRLEQDMNLAVLALLDGPDPAALATLDRIAASDPGILASIPAMSLRWWPSLRRVAGDPRVTVADEHIRAWVNGERAKLGLQPLTRIQWISDPQTLLTKN